MNTLKKVDDYISNLTGWQAEKLKTIREIVLSVSENIHEEWKWNCPVWVVNKPICAASSFKKHIKLNFFNGALFEDSQNLFNSGFESKKSRSINFEEGDEIVRSVIEKLVKSAIQFDGK